MSKIIEYAVLTILICTVWSLLALPIVFYHLPVYNGLSNDSNSSSPLQASDKVCSSPVVYKGTVCHDVLQRYRNCLPDAQANDSVLIPASKSTVASSVLEKIEVVKLFALSEECRQSAVPLICLYYFGPLCDTRGVAYKVSRDQCLRLSTGVCAREWKLAEGYVPDCNSNTFGNNTVLTSACGFHQKEKFNESKADVNVNCSVQCSENFYCKPGTNICVPTCSWKEHPEPNNTIIDVAVLLAVSIGVIFGVLLLISACFRRRKMCTFPSVIVIYQTVAALILASVTIVGYVGHTELYCRSNDLLESVRHATPFCVISGMILHYLLFFLTLWWICHISIMFWKLRFPFHARNFEIENRMKYVHIACAVLCFSLSFLPIIVISLDDVVQRAKGVATIGTAGFGLIRFPPLVCSAMNRNAVYYSLILPVNLIVPIGVTLMILVVWLLYKHHRDSVKGNSDKLTLRDATAFRKAFIIPCYYVIASVVGLTGLTIVSRNGPSFTKELFHYFACERRGDGACDRSWFERLQQPGLVAISFVLFGLFPFVNFIFTTNFSELKETLISRCSCRQKAATKESELPLLETSHKDTQASDGETSSN